MPREAGWLAACRQPQRKIGTTGKLLNGSRNRLTVALVRPTAAKSDFAMLQTYAEKLKGAPIAWIRLGDALRVLNTHT